MKNLFQIFCLVFLFIVGTYVSIAQQKGTVTDVDGNEYQTVIIGDQEWMAENLKTTKYNDGQVINFANGVQMDWYNNTSGMYTWYNSDAQNKDMYGALYNWIAATNTKICPVNWHVPTDDEWRTLANFVGTSEGTKLKATSGWNGGGNGTDDFGFAALPGGYVSSTFSYSNIETQGLWWTTVEKNIDDAYNAELSANNDWLDIYYHGKKYGLSIRCIKDEGVIEELATVSTTTASSITQTSATSGGNVTDDGGAEVTGRGVCWSTSTNPTTADNKTTDGVGTGEFTSSITSLTANTTYYIRAYATNSVGTSYGNEVQFTTEEEASTTVPTLTTTTVTNITQTTASSGGAITNDGGADITAKGVVWSATTNPTLDSNDGQTSNGTGTAEFNSDLTALTANTTYYVRAYATNSAGTGYGNEVQFATEEEASTTVPTLTTTTVTNITQTTASSGGAITNDGGADITAKGVVWSATTNPTLDSNDGQTSNGTGTAEFNSDLTALTANTTYYVRAYATNSAGTGYGNEVQFTTQEDNSSEDALPLPFTDSFEGDVSNWKVIDGDEDGYTWLVVSELPRTGDKHFMVHWNSQGNNDWLISPILDLPSGETIKLSFWAKSYSSPFLESFNLKVISDGGNQIDNIASEVNVPENYTQYSYNLSAYAGQEVEIAIVCVSVDEFYLYVDDFTCEVEESTVELPILTTMAVTNIAQTTASSGGAITNDGGADITAKGVVWSTTTNPTLDSSDGYTTNGTGTSEFTSELSNLSANTTYYVRAYATNSAGTAYGDQKTFETLTTSTGFESITSLKAFPNPFTHNMSIVSDKGVNWIEVVHISGQTLFVKQANGQINVTLETKDLQSGLYILRVYEIDGTLSNLKVVKK